MPSSKVTPGWVVWRQRTRQVLRRTSWVRVSMMLELISYRYLTIAADRHRGAE